MLNKKNFRSNSIISIIRGWETSIQKYLGIDSINKKVNYLVENSVSKKDMEKLINSPRNNSFTLDKVSKEFNARGLKVLYINKK